MNRLNDALRRSVIAGGFLLAASAANAADGVEINHLGVNNTLVRINGDAAKYLILPVEDNMDDARVNVLVDGKIDKTIYVRLAKNKADFTVPFDLTPYKGHEVVLDILSPQSRSSVREASNDACWKGISLSDTFDTANVEKYRPSYHHTPAYGWMNDPNGMFYQDGKWHLYYQWNPYGSKWQNMSWGHSVSDDLVHWTREPKALEPDGIGAVFSGSAVIDKDNTAGFGPGAVVAIYTAAGTNQMQSIAYSLDGGKTFTPYKRNPVITLPTEARDPKVFWNEKTGLWNLVLAHALDHEMMIYSSPDLKDWTLESTFGKGLGAQGGVWECPDLFELPVAGTKGNKWIFICNINPDGPFGGSGTQYFIGEYDGHTFTPDKDKDGNVPTKWLDYGKDHYATVTWGGTPEGRRTAIGWMSNWQYAPEVPTMQFRSANTLPREISLFKAPDGQVYAASAPAPEVLKLRGDKVLSETNKSLNPTPLDFRLPSQNNGNCEIDVTFEAKKGSVFDLTLSNKKGNKVVLKYVTDQHILSFDRTESGVKDFSNEFAAVTQTETYEKDGKISLRIFVDNSSIEVFGNDGRFVMTNLVFPEEPYSALSLSAPQGYVKVTALETYTIPGQ